MQGEGIVNFNHVLFICNQKVKNLRELHRGAIIVGLDRKNFLKLIGNDPEYFYFESKVDDGQKATGMHQGLNRFSFQFGINN